MSEQPTVLVVGSANMDIVVRVGQMPAPGQTIPGEGFTMSPGGKGANQAVAASRAGAKCIMLGRVGDDPFGHTLKTILAAEDIDCEHLMITPDIPTGTAMIMVDRLGENSIVVSGGANLALTPDDIFPRTELFEQADIVILQLEVPMPTVRAAMDLARRHSCKIVLDPSPVRGRLPDELLAVDIITPNAVEAEQITGLQAAEERADRQVASQLIERGAQAAVLKTGARGSLVVSAEGEIARVQPYKVDIVDTTGAGDAFTGNLAVAVARGKTLAQAAKIANAAGALACTKFGAQTAIPTQDEINILMDDQR
ncbi:MAG: ribokinase [Phycisphaerales bacterium]|jgi:ribokinase|nr:ribokinase [Phycisphaerales bacterium]